MGASWHLVPVLVITLLTTVGQSQAVQALGSLHDQPRLAEIKDPELHCTTIFAYDQDDCTSLRVSLALTMVFKHAYYTLIMITIVHCIVAADMPATTVELATRYDRPPSSLLFRRGRSIGGSRKSIAV